MLRRHENGAAAARRPEADRRRGGFLQAPLRRLDLKEIIANQIAKKQETVSTDLHDPMVQKSNVNLNHLGKLLLPSYFQQIQWPEAQKYIS